MEVAGGHKTVYVAVKVHLWVLCSQPPEPEAQSASLKIRFNDVNTAHIKGLVHIIWKEVALSNHILFAFVSWQKCKKLNVLHENMTSSELLMIRSQAPDLNSVEIVSCLTLWYQQISYHCPKNQCTIRMKLVIYTPIICCIYAQLLSNMGLGVSIWVSWENAQITCKHMHLFSVVFLSNLNWD